MTRRPRSRPTVCCARRDVRRRYGRSTSRKICILDPDGDIVRHLRAAGNIDRHPGWACYHTELYVFRHDGHEYGIVGCAVGAALAVLVAEELFVSGCQFLVSMTSARQILPVQAPPYSRTYLKIEVASRLAINAE